jgi:hypothetical protein
VRDRDEKQDCFAFPCDDITRDRPDGHRCIKDKKTLYVLFLIHSVWKILLYIHTKMAPTMHQVSKKHAPRGNQVASRSAQGQRMREVEEYEAEASASVRITLYTFTPFSNANHRDRLV